MHIKQNIKKLLVSACALGMFAIPQTVNAAETVEVTFTTNITESPAYKHFYMYQDANKNGKYDEGEVKTTTGKLIVTMPKGSTLTDTHARFATDLSDNFDINSVEIVVKTPLGGYEAGEIYKAGKDCTVNENAEIEFRVPLADVTVETKSECKEDAFEYMYLDLDGNGKYNEGDYKFTEKETFKIPSSSTFVLIHPRVYLGKDVKAEDVAITVNDVVYTSDNIAECPKGEANVVFKYVGACPVEIPKAEVKFIDCEGNETSETVELTKETVEVTSPWGGTYTVAGDSTFTQEGCKVTPLKHTITLVDCSGEIIKEFEVEDGANLVLPDNYAFDELEIENITEDMTIKENAKACEIPAKEYTVTFLDCNGELISEKYVKEGEDVEAPNNYEFDEESLKNVQENLTLYALNGCQIEEVKPELIVTLLDCEGKTISIHPVLYGNSLELGEVGKNYDKSKLTNITSNLVLEPTNCVINTPTPTPSTTPTPTPTKKVVNTGNNTSATPYILGGSAVILCALLGFLFYKKNNKNEK